MQDQPVPTGKQRFARAWIALISAWVLTGAVFKLFWGTPALLPEVVRNLGFELGLTYNLAIGIELAIVGVALVKPRWGWLLQAALLVVFDVVLTTQIAAGAENCGCFGNKFSVPPWAMMAIDSALLGGLLLARPWSSLGPGLTPVAPIALAAALFALPWLFDRQLQQGEIVADGKPVEGQWLELALEKWVGKDIWDTPLGKPPLDQYLDVNKLPLDGLWVFWRQTCDHCAKHLEQLAASEHGERLITGVERISRPGRRVYFGCDDVPHVLGGLGTSILTTSRGVMTGREAVKAGVGGEVLCNIW